MSKEKEYNSGISPEVIKAAARALLPYVEKYFESNEGKTAWAEYLAAKNDNNKNSDKATM